MELKMEDLKKILVGLLVLLVCCLVIYIVMVVFKPWMLVGIVMLVLSWIIGDVIRG